GVSVRGTEDTDLEEHYRIVRREVRRGLGRLECLARTTLLNLELREQEDSLRVVALERDGAHERLARRFGILARYLELRDRERKRRRGRMKRDRLVVRGPRILVRALDIERHDGLVHVAKHRPALVRGRVDTRRRERSLDGPG